MDPTWSRAGESAPAAMSRAGPVALATLGTVLALVVVAIAVLHPTAADSGGRLAAAISALACGSWLVVAHEDSGVAGARGTAARRLVGPGNLIGAAVVLWGIGSLLQAVLSVTVPRELPLVGDGFELLAGPLALVGAAGLPRARSGGRRPLRLMLDAAMLGVAVALVAWRVALASVLEPFRASQVLASMVAAADIGLFSLAVLIALRERTRVLGLLVAGVALFAAGDLGEICATVGFTHGTATWPISVQSVLAWPLVVVAVARYRAAVQQGSADSPGGAPTVDPEARGLMIATTVSLLLLGVGLGVPASWLPGRLDVVTRAMAVLAVAVLAARELLDGRLRSDLIQRLHGEATVDPLTGLATRTVLTARLAAVPADRQWSLLVVGLDRFKAVNDLAGHAAGDALLRAVGRVLQAEAPAGSLVARVGGDEFAILVPGPLSAAAPVGQRFVAAVRGCMAGVERLGALPVSASVGVAAATPSGRGEGNGSADPLAALSAAGVALRAAKRAGAGRVEVYDEQLAAVRRRRLTVEGRLRSAIAAGQLRVHFQPIVDLRQDRLAGVEALARWSCGELGVVAPSEFIPVAEQTGLVGDLGEFMLNEALRQAVTIGLVAQRLRVSCNVSPVQLRVPAFHRVVAEALAAHGVDPGLLVVEVTEAVLIEEEGPAVRTLRRLADAGVTIAIDDFGTGYSALGYLRRLPAHILKLDRSLTSSLLDEPRAMAITRAVVDLGRSIGLSVVAEGIETATHARLVAAMGVGFGQGTYFGVPVEPSLLRLPGARLPA